MSALPASEPGLIPGRHECFFWGVEPTASGRGNCAVDENLRSPVVWLCGRKSALIICPSFPLYCE